MLLHVIGDEDICQNIVYYQIENGSADCDAKGT